MKKDKAQRAQYHREYIKARRMRALRRVEKGCEHIRSDLVGIHVHHLRPTGLMGRGRGSQARLRDIELYPDAYILLCVYCHRRLHHYSGY